MGIAALEGNWWYGGTLSAKGQEAIDGWAQYGLLL